MHGIIHSELKKYVTTKLGAEAWNKLVAEAGLGGKVYLPNQAYPDADALALVTTASKITGLPAGAILEDFGEFIAPDLMTMYASHVNPSWKTLEMLENTEQTIHRVVRARDKTAKPPELSVKRTGPNAVMIHYGSARKMCGVAKGIAKGLAKHYKQEITVSDKKCMLKGDPACEIEVAVTRN